MWEFCFSKKNATVFLLQPPPDSNFADPYTEPFVAFVAGAAKQARPHQPGLMGPPGIPRFCPERDMSVKVFRLAAFPPTPSSSSDHPLFLLCVGEQSFAKTIRPASFGRRERNETDESTSVWGHTHVSFFFLMVGTSFSSSSSSSYFYQESHTHTQRNTEATERKGMKKGRRQKAHAATRSLFALNLFITSHEITHQHTHTRTRTCKDTGEPGPEVVAQMII